jgi:hypothetical protein
MTNKILKIAIAVGGVIVVVLAVVVLSLWDHQRWASEQSISNTPTTSQSWQAGHDWVTMPGPIIGNSIVGNAKYLAQSHPEMSPWFCQRELNLYMSTGVDPLTAHHWVNRSDWYQGCLAGMAENSTGGHVGSGTSH